MKESKQKGKKVRIILSSGFHFSGTILSEDSEFLKIFDKFFKVVTLKKSDIQVLEVSE